MKTNKKLIKKSKIMENQLQATENQAINTNLCPILTTTLNVVTQLMHPALSQWDIDQNEDFMEMLKNLSTDEVADQKIKNDKSIFNCTDIRDRDSQSNFAANLLLWKASIDRELDIMHTMECLGLTTHGDRAAFDEVADQKIKNDKSIQKPNTVAKRNKWGGITTTTSFDTQKRNSKLPTALEVIKKNEAGAKIHPDGIHPNEFKKGLIANELDLKLGLTIKQSEAQILRASKQLIDELFLERSKSVPLSRVDELEVDRDVIHHDKINKVFIKDTLRLLNDLVKIHIK